MTIIGWDEILEGGLATHLERLKAQGANYR